MNNCPCCSRALLRQTHQGHIYWFCSSCWQEMPNFELRVLVNADQINNFSSHKTRKVA